MREVDSQLRTQILGPEDRPGWVVARLESVPYDLQGRPLIGHVVSEQLRGDEQLNRYLEEVDLEGVLVKHLTRRWAYEYASGLQAALVRDLGPRAPSVSEFVDPSCPSVSLSKAWNYLNMAGIAPGLLGGRVGEVATVLAAHEDLRFYIADTLFDVLLGSSDARRCWDLALLFTREEGSKLGSYPGFSGQGKSIAPHGGGTYELEMRMAMLTQALLRAYSEIQPQKEIVVKEQKIHIKGTRGDVNFVQDSPGSVIGRMTSGGSLGLHLRGALGSDAAADSLYQAIVQGEFDKEPVDGEVLQRVIESAHPSAEETSRLARLKERLVGAAISTPVVVALVDAISHVLGG